MQHFRKKCFGHSWCGSGFRFIYLQTSSVIFKSTEFIIVVLKGTGSSVTMQMRTTFLLNYTFRVIFRIPEYIWYIHFAWCKSTLKLLNWICFASALWNLFQGTGRNAHFSVFGTRPRIQRNQNRPLGQESITAQIALLQQYLRTNPSHRHRMSHDGKQTELSF